MYWGNLSTGEIQYAFRMRHDITPFYFRIFIMYSFFATVTLGFFFSLFNPPQPVHLECASITDLKGSQKSVMPYLRMFLGEKEIDQVLISELLLQSVIGHHTIEEEKERMREKYLAQIRNAGTEPVFTLDNVPSTINFFKSLPKNG